MIKLSKEDYLNKVLGCFMGKNIGGTLGAPFEWKRQVNNVDFYTQNLSGEPYPNDDLDIQLLWLIALEERGIKVDSKVLAEYWQLYVTPHWVEYGNAKINMKSGLMPPLSGILNNDFKDSNGSFIRSEIWACIAPGCPGIAAVFAYEDAIIDHGDGEGLYAEIFCAALESAAFVINDINKLINIGLSYIPDDCGVLKAVNCAVNLYKSGKTWLEARDEILRQYRGSIKPVQYDGLIGGISKEDEKKGFKDGKIGYDAPCNIGILIIGLLYGQGDFGKTVTIVVNCGEDTDCTAATCGAIFGIMNGIKSIPDKWIEPIGRKIKTGVLNLGELGLYGSQLPSDIDELTDRVFKIAQQVILRYSMPVEITESGNTDLKDLDIKKFLAKKDNLSIYKNLKAPVFHFDFFDVAVVYKDNPYIRDNSPKIIELIIENKYKVQERIKIHWYLPENWRISPSADGSIFISNKGHGIHNKKVIYEITTDRVIQNINRCVVELTFEGRFSVLLVPIVLLNGNLASEN